MIVTFAGIKSDALFSSEIQSPSKYVFGRDISDLFKAETVSLWQKEGLNPILGFKVGFFFFFFFTGILSASENMRNILPVRSCMSQSGWEEQVGIAAKFQGQKREWDLDFI